LFFSGLVVAQENAIVEDSLFSDVLQEQRKFQVRLPAEYFQKEGGAEISLVYLTPGVWDAKPFPTEQQYFKE
jgi:hypothetical protein